MAISDGEAAGLAVGCFALGLIVGTYLHKWKLWPGMSSRVKFERKPFLPGLEGTNELRQSLLSRNSSHGDVDYVAYDEVEGHDRDLAGGSPYRNGDSNPATVQRSDDFEMQANPHYEPSDDRYLDVNPPPADDSSSRERMASYVNTGGRVPSYDQNAAQVPGIDDMMDPAYDTLPVTAIAKPAGDAGYANIEPDGNILDSSYEEVSVEVPTE